MPPPEKPKFKKIDRSRIVFLQYNVLLSPEYRSLRAASRDVYMIFLYKRDFSKKRSGKKRKITNNGDIQFTEHEAFHKWGIKKRTFWRAIAQLTQAGIIRVNHKGYGFEHDVNLYELIGKFDGIKRAVIDAPELR